MAKKKENKLVGYAVISVIPLIGIIWAAIAGMSHNSYVKDAKKAEETFESDVVQAVNSLDESYPTIDKKLNITSAVPKSYRTKLVNDTVSTGGNSFTVTLGANPTTAVNEKGATYVTDFEFEYEFFITRDVYTQLTEAYDKDSISEVGYKDYIFLTYYKNNPKSSPIYQLQTVFKDYYRNVNFYKYNNQTIVGVSEETVIDLINNLGTITVNSKSQLDQIKATYDLLSAEQQEAVTNYDLYTQALSEYNIVVVEDKITNLPNPLSFTTSSKVEDARKAYDKLTDIEKAEVSNYDALLAAEIRQAAVKIEYYIDKAKDADEADNATSFKSYVSNAAKFYNQGSKEIQQDVGADYMTRLRAYVDKYNDANYTPAITLTDKE